MLFTHVYFRFLENVEAALHSAGCPVWDPTFRPALPLHAQNKMNAVQSGNQPIQNNAATAQIATAPMQAITPKEEPMEIAEAENLDIEQPSEHPSAAVSFPQNPTTPTSPTKDGGQATLPSMTADPSDLSFDIIQDILQQMEDNKNAAVDGDVSWHRIKN